jgi:hypothetical protein
MDFSNRYYKDIRVTSDSLLHVVKDDYAPKSLSDYNNKPHMLIDEDTQLIFKQSNTGCTVGELLVSLNNIHENFKPLVESNNHNAEEINKLKFDISRDGEIFRELGSFYVYCNKTDHAILTRGQELHSLSLRLDNLSIRNRVLFLSNSILSFFLIIFLILLVNRF